MKEVIMLEAEIEQKQKELDGLTDKKGEILKKWQE